MIKILFVLQLIDQLKVGGRMFIPVGQEGVAQMLYEVDKNEDGSITKTPKTLVAFVPLTSREHQHQRCNYNKITCQNFRSGHWICRSSLAIQAHLFTHIVTHPSLTHCPTLTLTKTTK